MTVRSKSKQHLRILKSMIPKNSASMCILNIEFSVEAVAIIFAVKLIGISIITHFKLENTPSLNP